MIVIGSGNLILWGSRFGYFHMIEMSPLTQGLNYTVRPVIANKQTPASYYSTIGVKYCPKVWGLKWCPGAKPWYGLWTPDGAVGTFPVS